MKSCIIGSVTQDVFLKYDTSAISLVYDEQQHQSFALLPKGGKIEVTDMVRSIGGGASNISISFARLHQKVGVVALCGADAFRDIHKQLDAEHVVTTFLQKSETHSTGFSCIIPTKDGDRVIFSYPGANGYLEHKHVPFMIADQYDLIFVAPLHGSAQHLLPEVVQFARSNMILSAVNPSWAQLTAGFDTFKDALAHIDILILNRSEAQELMANMLQAFPEMVSDLTAVQRTTADSMPRLLHAFLTYQTYQFTLFDFAVLMHNRGPRTIVVTNGKEGVYVIADMSIYFHASIPVPVICTLGAGDAFGSTFVAYILEGDTLQEALVAGVLNASHVITHFGAHEGLASGEILHKQVAQIGTGGIQRFAW